MRGLRAWAVMVGVLFPTAGCIGDDAPQPTTTTAAGPDARADDGGDGAAPSNRGTQNSTDVPPSAAQPGDGIATGHIRLGSPTTRVRSITILAGVEGVDSFRFRLDASVAPGTVLGTDTTDGAGAGFDVDVSFHDADGQYLGGCNGAGDGEEECELPEGATQGTVDAFRGAELDVQLIVVATPGSADAGPLIRPPG